ncbi:MAG: CAP domain-containing protein [Elusimicrobia bacterium]|nr:CAP domain-containing protein [Elusimicrobiota bacterium]
MTRCPSRVRLLTAALQILAGLLAGLTAGCGPSPDASSKDLVLPGPGASSYGEGASRPSSLSLLVEKRLGSTLQRPPAPDACLDRAAEALAAKLGPSCELWPVWMEEHILHHAGCPDLGMDSIAVCSNGRDPARFLDRIALEAPRQRADRFGAGRASKGLLSSAWVYVAVERGLFLDPVPRGVAADSQVRIGFSLSPGLEAPRVYSMGPGGGVTLESVLFDSAPGKHLSYIQARVPGRHWVEVMASGAGGPKVVALFPVDAGVPVPRSFQEPARAPIKAGTADEAETALLGLLNEERTSRGLAPVQHDPELGKVARAWSAEMRRQGQVVHVSPDSQGPGERAAAAGYSSKAIGEVLASGNSVREAHEALMASPAHRAGMLDPRFTHAGIGASLKTSGDAGPVFYVAEELSLPPRSLSAPEAASSVLERAMGHRRSFGLPEAESPPALASAGQGLLAAWTGSEAPSFLAEKLGPSLEAAGWKGPCDASLQVVSDPDDFILPASLSAPRLRGLAVAGREIPVGQEPEGSAGTGGRPVVLVLLVAPK